ncbi:vomeronasal type-2 receptor 26-like [Ranitomeya variabilis]|uniref:vomeronasal type-2 receptor 26-like n=1 Tax=Ranitomeya variabilis TaxID=490064 RepID=UPI0040566153
MWQIFAWATILRTGTKWQRIPPREAEILDIEDTVGLEGMVRPGDRLSDREKRLGKVLPIVMIDCALEDAVLSKEVEAKVKPDCDSLIAEPSAENTLPYWEIPDDAEEQHRERENCQRCPDHEWPNKEKSKCVFRDYEFVSYETDVLASVFSIISILLLFITVLVMGIFTLFWKSPIVRANNRNLSFILLISLMFSVLCVFLFIGCPLDITCMLRQVFFGILFTVAESSILAKTIIVCIAFKATRPDSPWRKCVGVRLPYSVVLVCSSLQIGNAVIWLSVSPPYQEFNLDYPGKIIIQCNEGSLLAFYFMLGYMGFLAAVSFFLAFMVRTLPDIYNEAKYITFSMLVFCIVWICAIPAYLSSTGKHMVTVEIFAILTSVGAILSCIFLPKCYNIFMMGEKGRKRNQIQK